MRSVGFFLKQYFEASTQSLKEEGALENHAFVFELIAVLKCNDFFLGYNSYYF